MNQLIIKTLLLILDNFTTPKGYCKICGRKIDRGHTLDCKLKKYSKELRDHLK